MNDRIRVDLDNLEDLVIQLRGAAQFINEHLDTLDRKASAVHSGSWTGIAAEAHKTAHDQWMAAASEFTAAIDEMRVAAHTAHSAYHKAIGANQRMFRKR